FELLCQDNFGRRAKGTTTGVPYLRSPQCQRVDDVGNSVHPTSPTHIRNNDVPMRCRENVSLTSWKRR
ncbi:hypothetical protein Csa_023522, partial [Cucumis sativus]